MKQEEIDSVIDGLGGPSALGRDLGLDRRVVANWRVRGIPLERKIEISRLAQKKNFSLPKKFLPEGVSVG